VCYGILTEHGGTLDVQSSVGYGTTFTITLPASTNGE
jgi:signal transduction histidine kinase